MSDADSSIRRILDANVNRAREALRVMEEYARFVLDDALLTQAIKEARHELVESVGSIVDHGQGARAEAGGSERNVGSVERGEASRSVTASEAGGSLTRSRNIEGDVGRQTKVESETRRQNLEEVVRAAAARLSEALRVLEEYGKTIDARAARAIEHLRYRGYELERRLVVTIDARRRFADIRLYVIITESLCRGDWFETARAAIDGGADAIQLREKGLPDRELLARARRLASLCRAHGAMLIINDRADIAVAAGADGVHLGQDDLEVPAARRVMAARCLVGVSTHTIDQFDAAVRAAPDYVAVGPMFPSQTKPQEHISGPATLHSARSRTSLPLVAIGGIQEDNIAELALVPNCVVCVCSAVIARPDPGGAARALRALLDRVRQADGPSSSPRRRGR